MNVLRAVSHCVSRQQGYSCSSLVCTAVASSLVCSINESIITSTTMLPFHKVLRAVSVTVCLGSKGCSAGQPPLLVGQPPLLVGQRQADGCFAHPGPTVAGGAAVAPALWRAPGHLRTRQLQPCRRPKPARAVYDIRWVTDAPGKSRVVFRTDGNEELWGDTLALFDAW